MSTDNTSSAQQEALIDCKQLLYRAMRSPSWVDKRTKKVRPVAFILRSREKDSKGLSIDLNNEAWKANLRDCYGVGITHTGKLRDLRDSFDHQFEIVADPESESHANIEGLPYPEDGEEATIRAEKIAGHIAKQVRECTEYALGLKHQR